MREDDTLGARLARIRKTKDLTQAQLAQASGVSKSMISKVEAGHASPSTSMVGTLARALGVDASRLHGGGTDEPESLHEMVPTIRRTLAAVDLMDDDIEPLPLHKLAPRVAKVGEWRRNTRYSKIAAVLPELVDQLLIAGRNEGEPAYALLTDAYRAANTLSHKLGYSDLSLTATERMEWAATKSGDPLLLATVHYVKAATLDRIGAQRQALKLLTRSMADIEPIADEDATAAAVYSTLHMRAGTIAATMGDADASRAHLAEAERLATTFPDGVAYDTVVGPANVRLYQISAETDLGNPGRAAEIASATHLPAGFARERQTYFWLDTARAHLGSGNPDLAIEALYESRAVSPEHFRSSPTVKSVIKTAAQQKRRASHSLRALANSAGIED